MKTAKKNKKPVFQHVWSNGDHHYALDKDGNLWSATQEGSDERFYSGKPMGLVWELHAVHKGFRNKTKRGL